MLLRVYTREQNDSLEPSLLNEAVRAKISCALPTYCERYYRCNQINASILLLTLLN